MIASSVEPGTVPVLQLLGVLQLPLTGAFQWTTDSSSRDSSNSRSGVKLVPRPRRQGEHFLDEGENQLRSQEGTMMQLLCRTGRSVARTEYALTPLKVED